MHKGRVEAFSDAVIAIALTIMVLDLHPPQSDTVESLKAVLPVFGTYALSFLILAIYWNNHHHMLQVAKHVNGAVLWANMHLLFWLSLIPFVTAWMGQNPVATWPEVMYGAILCFSGVAYYILTNALVRANGEHSTFAKALGGDFKGKISVVIYVIAIGIAFVAPAVALALYVSVTLIWLIPDRRFERAIAHEVVE